MLGLFLLWCLAAANAAQLGYDYRTPGRSIAAGSELTSGGSSRHETIGSESGSSSESDDAALNELGRGFGGFTGSATNAADIEMNVDAVHVGDQHSSVEFNKEFYSYTAPEDDFNDIEAMERIASSLKRNLRVVFIKSPEQQALTNAALQLAKQASEERTAIYVLTKQADVGGLAQRLQLASTSGARKPEVHFVKYRTQDEAQRAQQEIQAQYETLGGSSHSSNEGVAPVLDFATTVSSARGDAVRPASYLPPALT